MEFFTKPYASSEPRVTKVEGDILSRAKDVTFAHGGW